MHCLFSPNPITLQRHHSPDSTKVDAVIEAKEPESKTATPDNGGDSTLPPPPSKWEKDDGASTSEAGAKITQAELVTSSA